MGTNGERPVRIGRQQKQNSNKPQAQQKTKPKDEEAPSENPQLLKIYERALDKIQAGEFTAKPESHEIEEGLSDEEEVLHWMLAKWLKDRGLGTAYKTDFSHLKVPKGVQFPTNNVSMRDIVYFVSPQTELVWGKNPRIGK